MKPIAAIVGRPNVGKSTFFNNLTSSRDALVVDRPGITRDRQYGVVYHNLKSFLIIDTGGIGEIDHDSKEIADLMTEQSMLAANESSILIWIVDGRTGLTNVDEILAKINHMIVGCDCRWIILDHLHMIVSASDERNERALIDRVMTQLRKTVEKTGVGLILVSHLKRIEGNKGHEEGASVATSHIRGSGGIAHLADCIITLERNQQAKDEIEAHRTRLKILKSRYTGEVGIASYLQYDSNSGRLREVADPDEEDFSTENYTSEDDDSFEIPF